METVNESLVETNQDYETLTRVINVLKYQEERAIIDIETLKRRKKEALKDPITFVEQLRDGTNEKLPKRQIVFPCPNINWDKYGNLPLKNSRRTSDVRFSPYSTRQKVSNRIRSSELMNIVMKGAAELGIHPHPQGGTTIGEESSERNSDEDVPLTSTVVDDTPIYSRASPHGKGSGKDLSKMLGLSAEPSSTTNQVIEQNTIKSPSSEVVKSDSNAESIGYDHCNTVFTEGDGGDNKKNVEFSPPDIPTGPFLNQSNSTLKKLETKNDNLKPNNHNVPWTDEEQQRLIELLKVYPEEEVQSHRFKKISAVLRTRTPKQVASRVQKYFIKLARNGLPVPGRMPNIQAVNSSSNTFKPKKVGKVTKVRTPKPVTEQTPRKPRVSGVAYEQAQPPPTVYMPEEDDENIIKEMMISVKSPQSYIDSKASDQWNSNPNRLLNRDGNVHYGFSCDSCLIDPIVGVRYQCVECDESRQIDLCGDCMMQGNFENEFHSPSHKFFKITLPVNTPDDCVDENLGEYSYLGVAAIND